ncbi:MAG: hypothetical protein VKL42_12435 [Snowella sp.]|nr:hypothetical protein [Snowella sp.]
MNETQGIEPHQFKAFLTARPATEMFAAVILLACKKEDPTLLKSTWVYFSREFGSDYLIETFLEEVEPILTIEQGEWLWKTIRQPKETKDE